MLKSRCACRVFVGLVALAGHASFAAPGNTLHVPADYPSIQQAIAAAVNGDRVLVAEGSYLENLNFLGKAITVESESGPGLTVIDGNQAGSVVTFATSEGRSSILRGFTLRNGFGSESDSGVVSRAGGGVRASGASPTIEQNIIFENLAGTGGGISLFSSAALVRGNLIAANAAEFAGGGISLSEALAAELSNNVIVGNLAFSGPGGGIWVRESAAETPTIANNRIVANLSGGDGGGIEVEGAAAVGATILQNFVVANKAVRGGGINLRVPGLQARDTLVLNNTIADNDSKIGSGMFLQGDLSSTLISNNLVVARRKQVGVQCFPPASPTLRSNSVTSSAAARYAGCTDPTGSDGNVSLQPSFLDPTNFLYHLRPGSPGIDAGNDDDAELLETDHDGDDRIVDGDGNTTAHVDLGADEYAPGLPQALALAPATPSVASGAQNCVAAVVTDEQGNPVAATPVEFQVDGANARLETVNTDGSGSASFCYTTSEPFAGDDLVTAMAKRGAQPEAETTVRIVPPAATEGCKVEYSGRIIPRNGREAKLSGSASVKRGAGKGEQKYQELKLEGHLEQRLRNAKAIGLTCEDGAAVIYGSGQSFNEFPVVFRIDVEDVPETDLDHYRLRMSNGYDSGDQLLTSGRVKVRIKP